MQALECYWFMVLTELSKLLDFKPGRKYRQYNHVVPVSAFLSARKEGRRWAGKYGVDPQMFGGP